jgi:hypothetical protein
MLFTLTEIINGDREGREIAMESRESNPKEISLFSSSRPTFASIAPFAVAVSFSHIRFDERMN